MSDTTWKSVAMLIARRIAAWCAAALVAHGLATSGDPGLSGFTEVVAGALVGASEFLLEWYRNSGKVMITAQLARVKGIPLPQHTPDIPTVIPAHLAEPATGVNAPVEVKSIAA